MIVLGISSAVVLYPFFAGLVFRLLRVPGECAARGRKYTLLPCDGVFGFDKCAVCARKTLAVYASVIWPLVLPLLALRSVFRAGAGQLGSGE